MSDTRQTCRYCCKPIATESEYETIPEGDGGELCWSPWQGCDQDAEEAIDLRDARIAKLKRELAAAKDGWRDEICKAQADMRRAETMLNDERKHRAEAQSDYRCLAELLDGHDATECRANLVKLQAELAAERALADRLAASLDISQEHHAEGTDMPYDEAHTAERALEAWKEARRGTN
jgi:hypothetical protein